MTHRPQIGQQRPEKWLPALNLSRVLAYLSKKKSRRFEQLADECHIQLQHLFVRLCRDGFGVNG
jgi:hypothetical protein